MTTRMLGRRTFLRGLTSAGAALVGLPLLDVMLDRHGTALASGEPLPLRLGTFFWGNGIVPGNWVPAATGAGWAATGVNGTTVGAGSGTGGAVTAGSGSRLNAAAFAGVNGLSTPAWNWAR